MVFTRDDNVLLRLLELGCLLFLLFELFETSFDLAGLVRLDNSGWLLGCPLVGQTNLGNLVQLRLMDPLLATVGASKK